MGKAIRKIAIIVMAMTMLIGTFVLSGCDNVSLEDYKAAKSQSLQDYASAKGEKNYCADAWVAICQAVTDGKKAIEEATTKSAVVTAFNDAKGVIDKVDEEDVEMNGAYFATGESEGYAVIKGNLITVSHANGLDTVYDSFEFAFENGSYIGENIRKTISFKLSGNELMVQIAWYGSDAKKMTLEKNPTIEFSAEKPIQLEKPQDVTIDNAGAGLTLRLSENIYESGNLNVGVEVKQAGKDTFKLISIRDYYSAPHNIFVVNFNHLNLQQGTSAVRVFYIGGLFLQNNEIKFSDNSDAVYFNVTVDSQGNFTTTKM